jgi:hypothetical protein
MPTNSAISAAAIPTVVAIMPHSAVTDGLCARSIRMSGLTASGQAALIRVHPRFICSNGQKRTAPATPARDSVRRLVRGQPLRAARWQTHVPRSCFHHEGAKQRSPGLILRPRRSEHSPHVGDDEGGWADVIVLRRMTRCFFAPADRPAGRKQILDADERG